MFAPRRIATAILIAGWLAMLAMTAPGYLSYDSVSQLAGARSGLYNSWHPPVMAWLLGLFDAALPGTLVFLIFQSGLLLAGLLILLWRQPRNWWSVAMALVLVALPQWLLFQGEIWKDMLFADAAIAGFAAMTLSGRRAWLSLPLLVLAALTRQNGIVLLPVAAITLGWIAHRQGRTGWRPAVGFLLTGLLLQAGASLALAARGDGGQGASAQLRLGQAYDLAGALARQPGLSLPALRDDPSLARGLTIAAARYSPLRVDVMAADPAVSAALEAAKPDAVGRAWRELILAHPALYLSVRGRDFAAVLTTPDILACHFAPVGIDGDPAMVKSLGLENRVRPRDRALAQYVRHFFATPVYSHLAWGLVALMLLVFLMLRRRGVDPAVAGLLAGALLFTMTFVIISIACDYRYLIFLDLSAMAGMVYVAGAANRPA